VLAFAAKTWHSHGIDHTDLTGMVFLGLQGMIDPPRAEAIRAVRVCQGAGIEVKMITGDHKLTAAVIAAQLDLGQGNEIIAYTGQELAQLGEPGLIKAAQAGSVFARVAPEQKLQLVEALQSKGHIVAMLANRINPQE
jgi:magnesium-transporting ATPase (P-type)